MMTMADENENLKYTRDTVVLTVEGGGVIAADSEIEPNPSGGTTTATAAAGGHVKYVIEIKHGEDSKHSVSDTWQTAKR